MRLPQQELRNLWVLRISSEHCRSIFPPRPTQKQSRCRELLRRINHGRPDRAMQVYPCFFPRFQRHQDTLVIGISLVLISCCELRIGDRPGLSLGGRHCCHGNVRRRQHGVVGLSRHVACDIRQCGRQWLSRAEGALPAEDRFRRVGRNDVPDRTARRHGSRPASNPRHPATRRDVPHHGHQDLHLRRRTGPDRKRDAPRAGADARFAAGRQGHLALHRAQVHPGRNRRRRSAQCRDLRLYRTQAGHPRQLDLHHELRRGNRLAAG